MLYKLIKDAASSVYQQVLTRIAGILIHSRLKALAVNLNRPSGRLWLYAGLIGSNNPRRLKADLVACANLSSSSTVISVRGWMLLLVPAHLTSSGQRAIKRLCVCSISDNLLPPSSLLFSPSSLSSLLFPSTSFSFSRPYLLDKT